MANVQLFAMVLCRDGSSPCTCLSPYPMARSGHDNLAQGLPWVSFSLEKCPVGARTVGRRSVQTSEPISRVILADISVNSEFIERQYIFDHTYIFMFILF